VSAGVGSIVQGNNLYTSASGGDTLQIYYDNLADFVSSPAGNFGPQTVMCQFGNRLTAATAGITANPNNFNPPALQSYVTCQVPVGSFNLDGPLTVFLNPYTDVGTSLSGAAGWRWLPYSTKLSRRFGLLAGYDTVVVQGGGFCAYHTATCSFGGSDSQQAIITNDHMLTCIAPPHLATVANVQVSFCTAGCNCQFNGSPDTITSAQTYSYVGVSSISPQSGPTCGSTLITINGVGFSQFNYLQCFWGKQVNRATYVNDTTITCLSINSAERSIVEQDYCYPLTVIGYRNGEEYLMDVPTRFLFGTPQVLAVTPSSVDIDQPATIVTVSGEFFNGISPQQTNFECRLGTNPPVAGQLVQKGGSYVLTCANLFNRTTATIGSYPLEISFACSVNQKFTTNHVPLRIIQNPSVLTINPRNGPFIGGVQVTVQGTQFNGGTNYLCSFGDFTSDNNLLVSGTFISNSQISCLTPYMPVSFNTPVQLAVSLDGGQTYAAAPDDYIVEEIDSYETDLCPLLFNAADRLMAPSMLVLLVLALLMALL